MMGGTTHWLERIEEAERWLNLARSQSEVPAKAADCLYEVMVCVTRAVMELEKNSQERGD